MVQSHIEPKKQDSRKSSGDWALEATGKDGEVWKVFGEIDNIVGGLHEIGRGVRSSLPTTSIV